MRTMYACGTQGFIANCPTRYSGHANEPIPYIETGFTSALPRMSSSSVAIEISGQKYMLTQ